MQQSGQSRKITVLSQLHGHPAFSIVGFRRPRGHASGENILLDILGKTDINSVGAVDMGKRLSSYSQLNAISTAIISLNARHQQHLSSNDIQQSHWSQSRTRGLISLPPPRTISIISGAGLRRSTTSVTSIPQHPVLGEGECISSTEASRS